MNLSGGLIVHRGVIGPGESEMLFSQNLRLPGLRHLPWRSLRRALFSFNNPYGACPTCAGLGVLHEAWIPT